MAIIIGIIITMVIKVMKLVLQNRSLSKESFLLWIDNFR